MTTSPKPVRGHRSSDLKRMRRKCLSRLDTLNIAASCDLSMLCAHLSQQRGRPLYLSPLDMQAPHPCGVWVASNEADFIFYEASTSKAHQKHIIMHELAHIICHHRGCGGLDDASARLLFPDVDPELVRDMLRRTTYSDFQEWEAETMASLMLLNDRDLKSIELDGVDNLPGPTETLARIKLSLMRRQPGRPTGLSQTS